ncbi:ketopantoate reductase family protein [Aspergillus clavatus NRRL 1]|uniref:2-dehydropantoate 2-reductase n=1 Tax=Aspergillus clavatus (strain ATCC 1007 / CBS 513.65 / DSM 816 / NCTC 3887 / NRRL 1 / QM 1276 / 107) TaxID=344612 RepID=A1CIW3_ASPCL|nr:2-dehydropantoate 2-reductase [Aspergillus clavatus NRRL 1]EAW10818.1 2-dehydropantoate 2-reductase [Aspergillus clavatus NRRL 1]
MTQKPPHILIFGVGSIGAIHLLQLQRAGCTTTAVCRSNYDAVKQKGFSLTSVRFGNVNYRPDHVVRTVEECPKDTVYDYVLVTAKCFPGSQPSLADLIRPAVAGRPETAIVLAQNGIEIEKDVADAFPENPIISGVIYLPGTQTSPGVIDYPEMLNMLELGTYPANAPAAHQSKAQRLVDLMIQGGGEAKYLEDIQVARFAKLLVNAPWNPICALSLCTDGDFLLTSDPFAHELVWGIMMEIVALAKKVGIPGVDEAAAKARLITATRRAEMGTGRDPSMLQDVKSGRLFEVEAIVGNTVRLARKWGVSMPRLETVYALAKGRYEALVNEQQRR